jgi:hypothetical protein
MHRHTLSHASAKRFAEGKTEGKTEPSRDIHLQVSPAMLATVRSQTGSKEYIQRTRPTLLHGLVQLALPLFQHPMQLLQQTVELTQL